jgi:hypothetical protein
VYDFGERGRVLRTASRKLDFAPLASALARSVPREEPVASAAPGDAASRPLELHLFPLLTAFGDSQGPLPWVQDSLGRDLQQSWNLWVELAPSDAKPAGIADGAWVKVESDQGSVEARARVYPGVRPGVAAMPLGPGGAPGGTVRRALGAVQAAALVAEGGAAAPGGGAGGTWVRIRRA